MKKLFKFLSVGLLCIMVMPAVAQDGEKRKGKREKIDSMRVAFFNEKMELTQEEAKKFWPIYNEHQEKKDALRKELRKAFKKQEDGSEMSDEELEKLMQLRFETDQKIVALDREYHEKYKSAIGIKKTAKLYKAEVQFKKELLKMMRERRGEHPGPGKGGPRKP